MPVELYTCDKPREEDMLKKEVARDVSVEASCKQCIDDRGNEKGGLLHRLQSSIMHELLDNKCSSCLQGFRHAQHMFLK
jgi:hypothetical protein